MIKKILLLTFLCAISACATQQFRTSETQTSRIPKSETAQSFFLYGVGQTKETNAAEVCGKDRKVSEVSNALSPMDAVAVLFQHWFIFIEAYSPRTNSITCS